jgi:2-polyprenyl-3-methyl-5-hydroxy-6-metoxy-1,4-benzoquinol methylase
VPDNAYNEVPYPTFPNLRTHPDRLAALGTLFGMSPAPVDGCRVLEIGCGDASNLIPMACSLPASRFVGVDLARGAIEAGRRAAADLALPNLALEAADLCDIGEDYGEFDYIIAHGVYSWAPAEVRDRLLAVCRERMAEQGIAFVSYNAYPGAHFRQMLREMLLRHTRGAADAAERIRQARRFLDVLRAGQLLPAAFREVMEGEVRACLERGDAGLYHDDLAEFNQPVYFHEFAEHARRHALAYLGEAEPHEMFDASGAAAPLDGDIVEREQYLDFLKLRRFRQTLLCRREVALDRRIRLDRMDRFLFSAPARAVGDGRIEGLRGVKITTGSREAESVAGALGDCFPLPAAFDDLLPYAGSRETLREIVYSMVAGGFADLHVYDFPCEETVTRMPRAGRLARYQAAKSRNVVNACHRPIELDEIGRQLLLLLDGTRDRERIARDLAEASGLPYEKVRDTLGGSLEWMARCGLLEG